MPQGKRRDKTAKFRSFLQNMRTSTEQEFTRTANTWIACFVSNTFIVDMYLELFKGNRRIAKKRLRAARQNLEHLKEYVRALQRYYPDRNTIPPDEVKEELFQKLMAIAETLNR